MLALMGTMCAIRGEAWKDSPTLWMDVVDHYPRHAAAYNYLGSAFAVERGDLMQAERMSPCVT